MKMKVSQLFLDSLEFMSIEDAKYKVSKNLSMNCEVYDYDAIITRKARDCILLWVKDGLVMQATLGDPTCLVRE